MKLPRWIAGVTAVVVLSACSESTKANSQPNNAAGLKAAVQAMSEEMVEGNLSAVYESFSQRCRKQVSRKEFTALMALVSGMIEGLEVKSTKTRNVKDGQGEAAVAIVDGDDEDGMAFSSEDEWSKYVYEDGKWHVDDCEGMGEDGGLSFDSSGEDDGSGDETADDSGDVFDGELRPSDEVEAETESERATKAELGDTVDIDGIKATISKMAIGSDDFSTWLEVSVRTENRGEDGYNPNMTIVCAGSADGGGSFTGGTFTPSDELLSGSFDEGITRLTLPSAAEFSDPTPVCEGPAVVRVTPTMSFGDPDTADYPIPDDILAELNANRD